MGRPKKKDKPSHDDEITHLVNCIKNTENDHAFSELKQYLSTYISMFGKKYKIPGCDSDEIEQECLFALRYKAIEDFNPERGKFKSFAILCIKRHLFSLIKGNNQLKRRVLNTSLSLDQDRMENGESLSLASLIKGNILSADDQLSKNENFETQKNKLIAKLSSFEREVLNLYLQQLHYDEIVVALKLKFPNKKNINKKAVDNSLVRARSKAKNILDDEKQSHPED